jgi:hypothetical protein
MSTRARITAEEEHNQTMKENIPIRATMFYDCHRRNRKSHSSFRRKGNIILSLLKKVIRKHVVFIIDVGFIL